MPKIKTCEAPGCQKEIPRRRHYCSAACHLWSKVDRTAGPDACWIWKGRVNPRNGYGQVTKRETAHRLSYRLHHNTDPGELCVLHRCDVRTCVAPHHLFLGTRLDNWRDSVAKGRQSVIVPGEAHPKAKLTTAEVLAIRGSAAKTRDLVREFGVLPEYIRRIRARTAWAHIPEIPKGSNPTEWVFMTGVMNRPTAHTAI